jgi:hypothetical protein
MNALADVVNGQQNTIEILFENKTPDDVMLKTISGVFDPLYSEDTAERLCIGSFSNPKTGVIMRNVRDLTSTKQLPLTWQNRLQPGSSTSW